MNMSIKFVCLFLALVCFVIKAFSAFFTPPPRIDFMNLGFAFLTAAFLFG